MDTKYKYVTMGEKHYEKITYDIRIIIINHNDKKMGLCLHVLYHYFIVFPISITHM